MTDERIKKIEKIFREYGPVVKASILRQNKLCSRDIAELIILSKIKKNRTGYYSWISEKSEPSDFEIIYTIIPSAVVCLFSAAMYYELATLNVDYVSVAIPANITKPVLPNYPPIKLFAYPTSHFDVGKIIIGTMYIYDIERTVCDFFRKRYKIGEDISLEVLKNYMALKNKNIQKLLEYAVIFGIKSKIKPYVEALL